MKNGEDPRVGGCYPYTAGTPHCGAHCKEVDLNGSCCVLEPHDSRVHVKGTPPCDPRAAVKFGRSPASGPSGNPTVRGDLLVDCFVTGHRWRWNYEHTSWEDFGPIAGAKAP